MNLKDLFKPKMLSFLIFGLYILSYINWLIVYAQFGLQPYPNFFFYFSLPYTSLLSLVLLIFKIQEIDIYFAPIVFFAIMSISIFFIIKKYKWHSISYIANIYLGSWVLLQLVSYFQEQYYWNNGCWFEHINIYSFDHPITRICHLVLI